MPMELANGAMLILPTDNAQAFLNAAKPGDKFEFVPGIEYPEIRVEQPNVSIKGYTYDGDNLEVEP